VVALFLSFFTLFTLRLARRFTGTRIGPNEFGSADEQRDAQANTDARARGGALEC
jgi:hypothetical protein